jgi:uracil-DNA glycosylase
MAQHADLILDFLKSLDLRVPRAWNVQVLNPYQNPETLSMCETFYRTFYADSKPRHLILGINPGRLGGGITGVPFTDPIRLQTHCGIENTLPKKPEISSEFIYQVVDAMGGPATFFGRFYLSAVSPIGFTRDGYNINYFDVPQLKTQLQPLVRGWLEEQLDFGLNREVVFCLGEGANFRFLSEVNAAGGYFNRVVPLPHPRYIMQCKRKQVPAFIEMYRQQLTTDNATAGAGN